MNSISRTKKNVVYGKLVGFHSLIYNFDSLKYMIQYLILSGLEFVERDENT